MNQETTSISIVEQVRAHVQQLLREQLTEDHRYHNLGHTQNVCEALLMLGQANDLTTDELEVLEIAGWFHDTGFTQTYEGHEAISRQLAAEFLAQHGYPESKTQEVLQLIDVTFPPKEPSNLMEKIMCDADLSNVASSQYFQALEGLRHEWRVFLNQQYEEEEWYALNYKFVKKHHFYTDAARIAFAKQWNSNRKALKKKRDELRAEQEKQSSKDKPVLGSYISDSKSAQTMFKTSLRNHLDLSTLADNKANIMLSVNALIITIVMPLAASYVKDNIYGLIPMVMLLSTCLTSMIFATLATRPIRMEGLTDEAAIKGGKSNLFFFGNFYRMTYEDYEKGMLEVVSDNQKLDNSIMRDLYFLGSSLGRKYRQLRICYTIFMWGVIITVITFGLLYSWNVNG
ncbi:MAG: HD family phosphohydrolase [Bacteroidetes bacterium]|jgi:predicted metal-dependent HD superfamily phosphohydrolase|nr:HD family phosphohydrolase [Bacteroidota bacterium]